MVKVRNSAPLQQSPGTVVAVVDEVELVEDVDDVVAPGSVDEVVAPGTVDEVVGVGAVVEVVPAGTVDVVEGPPGQAPGAGARVAWN